MISVTQLFISQTNAFSLLAKTNGFLKKATLFSSQLENYRPAKSNNLSKNGREVSRILQLVSAKTIIGDNVNAGGILNDDPLLTGPTVISRVKYVMVTWIRENKFL